MQYCLNSDLPNTAVPGLSIKIPSFYLQRHNRTMRNIFFPKLNVTCFLLIVKKLITEKPILNQILTHFPLSLFLGVSDSQTQFPWPPTRCRPQTETTLPLRRWLWRAEKNPALSSSSSLFGKGINNWEQAALPNANNIMYPGSFDGGNLLSQSHRWKSCKLCS